MPEPNRSKQFNCRFPPLAVSPRQLCLPQVIYESPTLFLNDHTRIYLLLWLYGHKHIVHISQYILAVAKSYSSRRMVILEIHYR